MDDDDHDLGHAADVVLTLIIDPEEEAVSERVTEADANHRDAEKGDTGHLAAMSVRNLIMTKDFHY